MKALTDSTLERAARGDFHQRVSELRTPDAICRPDILERYTELEDRFACLASGDRTRLLESDFVWTPEEREQAAWLLRSSAELAALGHRIWVSLAEQDPASERSRHMAARALLHMGDAAKWNGVVHSASGAGFRRAHALMRSALDAGYHRAPARVALEDRLAECSVEALYFRALLLTRFSSGTFTFKQLEILDAWMWLWTPVLTGTSSPPAGGAFCVDLDSDEGLRPGVKLDCRSCLYLPVVPIQRAYAAIVAEFHAGRMVPATGAASRMRLEEHVAVLEIARRGLQGVASTPASRALRMAEESGAELFVGLGEVIRRAFAPKSAPAPEAPRTLALASRDGRTVVREARGIDIEGTYERPRLIVRVVNASLTGFGVEGEARDLEHMCVGDLVGLRLESSPTPQICKVARRVPSPGSTRLIVGLQRISSNGKLARLLEPASTAGESAIDAIYVPGADASGRHDAYLVPERDFTKRGRLEIEAGGRTYAVRFNRVRKRGPGWVLAGFEVVEARKLEAA